jgi:hypothetical protein
VLRSVRLSIAVQRWELLFVAIVALLVTAAMLWIAWQASQLVALDPACFAADRDAPRCRDVVEQFGVLSGRGGQLLSYTGVIPFGVGLVVGVPLVSREIEHGTADLAWTLSPSRVRWLVPRMLTIATVLTALLAILAIASEVVASAILPDLDLAADFTWYGQRGALLVMRGLLALAVGIVVGAAIGRQLPALLLAVAATVALFLVMNLAMDQWLRSDAIAARFAFPDQGVSFIGSRSLGGFFQLPSGAILTSDELAARGVDMNNLVWEDDRGEFYASAADRAARRNLIGWHVDLLVPGAKYPVVVAKESLLLAIVALTAGGLSLAVVDRRRPY